MNFKTRIEQTEIETFSWLNRRRAMNRVVLQIFHNCFPFSNVASNHHIGIWSARKATNGTSNNVEGDLTVPAILSLQRKVSSHLKRCGFQFKPNIIYNQSGLDSLPHPISTRELTTIWCEKNYPINKLRKTFHCSKTPICYFV